MVFHKHQKHRGFSLIEVLIVAAVLSLFFGGLFLTIQHSLRLISDTRGRLTALTVANDYMEYIRSLSYDNVGTVSGLPAGLIPQTSTSSLNGIVFTKRVLIEYIDSPGDGVGGADSNSITTDYKQAKVEVSWVQYGVTKEVFLISNVIPRSIETNVGGGTIRVNVTDANVAPLPSALVRLYNNSGTSTIDITKATDITGVALFGGAPAGANYQVTVTAPGYSTDKTYVATTSLPNPVLLPISVVAADISTVDLQIDRLGGLEARILSSQIFGEENFTFASSSDVASSTAGATLWSNSLTLSETAGVYSSTGKAWLREMIPSPLSAWEQINISASTTGITSYRVQVYVGTSTTDLVPDGYLAGNSAGITGSTIDLSGIDVVTYPSLTLAITLDTTNTSMTPVIHDVEVTYIEEETPAVGVTLTAVGAKVIGSLADTTPVYKTTVNGNTGSDGYVRFSNLEWDDYTPTIAGFDIAEICTGVPIIVAPGATTSVDIVTVPNTSNTLRVTVATGAGVPIEDANISISGASSASDTSSRCGQAFFSGLTSDPGYTLSVSAPGYTTTVISPIDVTGDTLQSVVLVP